jgi:hypothetical protein
MILQKQYDRKDNNLAFLRLFFRVDIRFIVALFLLSDPTANHLEKKHRQKEENHLSKK